jgi:1-deoxy-D-xylulose-5-phosphate synthase
VLGVPSAYLPHDKPDTLLSSLGLDADGVVSEIKAWRHSTATS